MAKLTIVQLRVKIHQRAATVLAIIRIGVPISIRLRAHDAGVFSLAIVEVSESAFNTVCSIIVFIRQGAFLALVGGRVPEHVDLRTFSTGLR